MKSVNLNEHFKKYIRIFLSVVLHYSPNVGKKGMYATCPFCILNDKGQDHELRKVTVSSNQETES